MIDNSPIEGDLCTISRVGTVFCIANTDGSGGIGAIDMDVRRIVLRCRKQMVKVVWRASVQLKKLARVSSKRRSTPSSRRLRPRLAQLLETYRIHQFKITFIRRSKVHLRHNECMFLIYSIILLVRNTSISLYSRFSQPFPRRLIIVDDHRLFHLYPNIQVHLARRTWPILGVNWSLLHFVW